MLDNQLPAELWSLSEAYLESIESYKFAVDAVCLAQEARDLAQVRKDRARGSLSTFFKASEALLPITIELENDRLITFSQHQGENGFRLVVTPKALPKPATPQ
jgi:hypothetical protein